MFSNQVEKHVFPAGINLTKEQNKLIIFSHTLTIHRAPIIKNRIYRTVFIQLDL